jgi:DNA-directed RNA polymerase beta subunit
MKTTAVRKLLPDQWGFLCPVHTPDGGPCGLLSHLALKCQWHCLMMLFTQKYTLSQKNIMDLQLFLKGRDIGKRQEEHLRDNARDAAAR